MCIIKRKIIVISCGNRVTSAWEWVLLLPPTPTLVNWVNVKSRTVIIAALFVFCGRHAGVNKLEWRMESL